MALRPGKGDCPLLDSMPSCRCCSFQCECISVSVRVLSKPAVAVIRRGPLEHPCRHVSGPDDDRLGGCRSWPFPGPRDHGRDKGRTCVCPTPECPHEGVRDALAGRYLSGQVPPHPAAGCKTRRMQFARPNEEQVLQTSIDLTAHQLPRGGQACGDGVASRTSACMSASCMHARTHAYQQSDLHAAVRCMPCLALPYRKVRWGASCQLFPLGFSRESIVVCVACSASEMPLRHALKQHGCIVRLAPAMDYRDWLVFKQLGGHRPPDGILPTASSLVLRDDTWEGVLLLH